MGLRIWIEERAGAGAEARGLGGHEMQTIQRTELDGPDTPDDARPGKESKRMVDVEKLAQMSLEALLYYVLVGEGRTGNEPVEG